MVVLSIKTEKRNIIRKYLYFFGYSLSHGKPCNNKYYKFKTIKQTNNFFILIIYKFFFLVFLDVPNEFES